jgi:IS4 transposase
VPPKTKVYRERKRIEHFFDKLKQFRRITMRYDKLGAAFLAFFQLAAVRIRLRSIESTTCGRQVIDAGLGNVKN